jgi:hypothetical protein
MTAVGPYSLIKQDGAFYFLSFLLEYDRERGIWNSYMCMQRIYIYIYIYIYVHTSRNPLRATNLPAAMAAPPDKKLEC